MEPIDEESLGRCLDFLNHEGRPKSPMSSCTLQQKKVTGIFAMSSPKQFPRRFCSIKCRTNYDIRAITESGFGR